MVAEEQVRQVPVQVCRMVAEERVEPVTTQVCRYVTEQRTAQVPRVVEKKEPYSYTVRSPRTVVMRVPLDPCGNPIPAASPAPAVAPAAAAKPVVVPQQAAPALTPAEASPAKTYSDKPADAPARVEEGWKGSGLDHVDPKSATQSAVGTNGAAGGSANTFRAERPLGSGTEGVRSAETIPTPSAKDVGATGSGSTATREPTVAPLGPSVEPAPPASDPKDVPAAGTSGHLRRIEVPASSDGQTT
jgi:hypothetical protein